MTDAIATWNRVSADESWTNPHAHIEDLITAGEGLLAAISIARAALASPAPQPEPLAPEVMEVVRTVREKHAKGIMRGPEYIAPAPVEPPPAAASYKE